MQSAVDPGGFQGFHGIPLFRVAVVCSHIDRTTYMQECRVLRWQNPCFEIPRSATDNVCNLLYAKRNKDVGMGVYDFLSLGGYLFVAIFMR